MERNKLENFLLGLTIASAIGLILPLLLPDFLPFWVFGLSVLGILVRADAMILETKPPMFIKILSPLPIVLIPILILSSSFSEFDQSFLLAISTLAYIVPPLIIVHLFLIFIYNKKDKKQANQKT